MAAGYRSLMAIWIGGAMSSIRSLAGYRIATVTAIYDRIANIRNLN